MDTTVSDPLVGRVLDGRYEVESRLARGGMATVYEATDRRLDRTVALKVMHPGLADDADFVARFIREAKSAARLSHPNVVAVYDQGADNGHVFLAMEYVAGRTLRDLIRERHHLAPGLALPILESVLAALGAAHQAGLIHRDIKPENVLLADDGRVKVADFGLARAVSTATSHTSTGVLIGTVAYLSPEQVTRGVADARSDVYAAGILLYEMLTGAKPYDGDSPIQVAYRHVHDDVPPPSSIVPGLPRELDHLVQRATSRDPDRRPADANQMLAEVVAVRRSLPPEILATALPSAAGGAATDVTVVVPVDRRTAAAGPVRGGDTGELGRRRRRRGPLALVVLLVIAALLGAGAWYVGEGRYTSAPSLLRLSQTQATQKAEQLGFGVRMGAPAFDESVPVGSVLRTDPAPNERIRKGGTITLTLSKGQERYDVPRLAGLSQDDALALLRSSHLSPGVVTRDFSDTVKAGNVISSTPDVGATLKRDAAVALVVSKGPQPVDVPDVVDKKVDDAKQAITKAGFQVKVSSVYDENVAKDHVISQLPAGGQAPKGSTVSIVASKGPPLVPLPDVLGKPVGQATRILQDAGFQVRAYGPSSGRVFSQSPRGGKAPKGSTITLFYI